MKVIVQIPCLNEEENIRRCHARVAAVLDGLEDVEGAVGVRDGQVAGLQDGHVSRRGRR